MMWRATITKSTQKLNVMVSNYHNYRHKTYLSNEIHIYQYIYTFLKCSVILLPASLPFYLMTKFLKKEADEVVVTVMEVYREETSVRRVRCGAQQNNDKLQKYWQEYINRERTALSLVEAASHIVYPS